MVYDWTTGYNYKSGVNSTRSAVQRVAHNAQNPFQVFVIAEAKT